ncbi:MAG: MoaD/ThiS family protein [Gemmatimonadota bacterium]
MTAPSDEIGVRVLFFGVYGEMAGERERPFRLPVGSSVADLVEAVRALPGFDWLPERPVAAVNRSYADAGTTLADGDDVALIPPVAGG